MNFKQKRMELLTNLFNKIKLINWPRLEHRASCVNFQSYSTTHEYRSIKHRFSENWNKCSRVKGRNQIEQYAQNWKNYDKKWSACNIKWPRNEIVNSVIVNTWLKLFWQFKSWASNDAVRNSCRGQIRNWARLWTRPRCRRRCHLAPGTQVGTLRRAKRQLATATGPTWTKTPGSAPKLSRCNLINITLFFNFRATWIIKSKFHLRNLCYVKQFYINGIFTLT